MTMILQFVYLHLALRQLEVKSDDLALVWTLCHSPSVSAPVFRCLRDFHLEFNW